MDGSTRLRRAEIKHAVDELVQKLTLVHSGRRLYVLRTKLHRSTILRIFALGFPVDGRGALLGTIPADIRNGVHSQAQSSLLHEI